MNTSTTFAAAPTQVLEAAPSCGPDGVDNCQPRSKKTKKVGKPKLRLDQAIGEWVEIATKPKGKKRADQEVDILMMDDEADGAEVHIGELDKDRKDSGEWVKVSAVVDTGAEVHVLLLDQLTWIPLVPSAQSKAGRNCRAANHTNILAKGRRRVIITTNELLRRRVDWEVCDDKRPLLSVTRIKQAGHTTHFTDGAAWITHTATETKTYFRREGGIWMLDLWVKRPPPGKADGFHRERP